MAGVTTAIVVFILASLAYPQFIKKKAQFYIAVGAVLGIIVFDAVGHMGNSGGGLALVYVIVALLQVVALIALVQAAGGPTAGEMTGEIGHAIEVVRRGEEEKEVIFPLSESMGQRTSPNAAGSRIKHKNDDESPVVYHLDDPEAAAKAPPPVPPSKGPLPLE
jgi:hypothetical protein